MKMSEVFERAARNMECGDHIGACFAIVAVDVPAVDDALKMFEDTFAPIGAGMGQYWWNSDFDQVNRNARVLALCFAAAIAKSEGL